MLAVREDTRPAMMKKMDLPFMIWICCYCILTNGLTNGGASLTLSPTYFAVVDLANEVELLDLK
jgi:hypothetical protein